MGQAESTASANAESPRDNSQSSSMESPSENSSVESLIADCDWDDNGTRVNTFEQLRNSGGFPIRGEAVAFGDAENESLDAKAERAMECPCIAHLRSGPCGSDFSEAFLCFLKSTAEEKGSDCVHPFVMLQSCIKAHPDAFSKDIIEDGEEAEKEANPSPAPRISPPRWSMESQNTKSKL